MKVVLPLLCLMLSVHVSAKCPEDGKNNTISAFFNGVYLGFQDEQYSSYCIENLRLIGDDWAVASEQLTKFFETGNPNNFYLWLNKLNIWANNLDTAVTDCNFALLVNRIEEILTLQEISAIITRIGIHTTTLIDNWKTILANFGTNACKTGEALGNALSIISGFEL